MIRHVYNDGGRAAAGRRGDARDCAARAISIATGIGYNQAYALINEIAKTERGSRRRGGRSSARNGVHGATMRRIMDALGWQWTPTMKIGEGCRVHLSADELPAGRIIVSLSRHYAAVIEGELHDTHDCSRDGTRCVYGYWRAPSDNAD
jgi:hypothetical protein